MRASHMRAILLAFALLAAALAGCAAPGPAADAEDGRPRGHVLAPSRVTGAAAAISGVQLHADAAGASTWTLAPELTSLGSHRALILHDADVEGMARGILLALPGNGTIAIDGPVTYTASTVSMDAERMRHRVAADPPARPGFPSEDVDAALRAAEIHDTVFFAESLALRLEGPATLRAERLLLVTAQGARELGDEARLASAGVASVTAELAREMPPARAALVVEEARGHLALTDGAGALRFPDDARDVPLRGEALVTLARANVTLAPDSRRVAVDVAGRSFQALVEGEAAFRSKLALRILEPQVDLAEGETREVAFELVALDPDTDPVITDARIERAPEGMVRLPGFQPLTQQLADEFGDEPLAFAAVAPALPFIAILDVFLAIVTFFGGPAEIPQAITAGTTFSSRLVVAGSEQPYEARVVVEGNFDDAVATLRVA